MPKTYQLDEVWAGEFAKEGDVLTRRLFQPDRPKVLEAVQTLRNEGVVQDRPVTGRWCLSIPHEDYEMLRRHPRWFRLHSKDGAEQQAAWREFLCHPDSAIYRVRDKAS